MVIQDPSVCPTCKVPLGPGQNNCIWHGRVYGMFQSPICPICEDKLSKLEINDTTVYYCLNEKEHHELS